MLISIGKNLRKLRLEKGLTQEQLAEELGVSPQAVSRWENDGACPDVTLLPALAIFYETSIDALMGMDEIRSAERKRQVHCQAHALVSAGDVRGAVKLLRDALRLYVNDSGLMLALTETLAHLDDPEAVEEAVRLGERALKKADISMKARCTATANLIFLCLKTGRNQRAAELAASLPHIWESREMLAPELLAGAEYAAGLKEAIMKALAFMCRRIDASSGHVPGAIPDYVQLGADLQTELTPAELLEKIRDFLI